MHIQIVSLNLEGTSQDEWSKLAEEMAPAFASVPGLISKVWLVDPKTDAFCGAIYTWQDREAMEEFGRSELFSAVLAHPNLANITANDYTVMETPTRVTRGFAGAVA